MILPESPRLNPASSPDAVQLGNSRTSRRSSPIGRSLDR
jgi:glucosamine--fructose-6-phosphate aminotransferase (isomerizing)